MRQRRVRAVFVRGGTSRALIFRKEDLPVDQAVQDRLFLAALGSPDPYGRQLDGLGGGISSLSKAAVIGPPSHPDADVDYTFAQVAVSEARVDYRANCGNISSAVGPFAVDERLVTVSGDTAAVRIHNTNTKKIIVSRFALDDGQAAVDGEFDLAGVAGRGARIRLEFLDPAGAATGRLLPTGRAADMLDVPGAGRIEASMVDATTPAVFVDATTLGVLGTESPDILEANQALMAKLEAIRATAAVAMGIATSPEQATRESASIPKIALVAPPREAVTLSGAGLGPDDVDVTVRMLSMGRPHRAVPLTGAMCLAVAARIGGTVVSRVARAPETEDADLRVAQPSGMVPVAAAVRREGEGWVAEHVVVYRTARRLMEGIVLVPASAMAGI
jgi:2-methylaconitate cis-trans-isomerase PrpF